MKRMKIPGAITAAVLILSITCAPAHAQAAGEVTQTFTLKPGWNAVFLDVQPEENDPATVFTGLPEESSVWAWIPLNTTVEFIQDPDEGLWNQPGWGGVFKIFGQRVSEQPARRHCMLRIEKKEIDQSLSAWPYGCCWQR